MRELFLTLPYPPSANRYWRNWQGRMVKSAEARAYQKDIQQRFNVQSFDDCMVELTINLYRPKKTGDLDNFLKVSIDALKGVCFNDDKQVRKITAEMFDDKSNPRVEITIKQYGEK